MTVLFVLLVCVVALGFYRGWFALSSQNPNGGNKVNINLTVDRDKMQEDAATVKKQATQVVGKPTEQVNGAQPQTGAKQ
jgi:cell division protein FtsX